MAFGAVLEGPDPVNLRPIVEQAMPMLIELMHDPSVVVKDTAAWTIGRVCELHTEAAINEVTLRYARAVKKRTILEIFWLLYS